MSCGEGVRRRDVVCVKKLDKLTVIVSDENCIEEDRVEEEEACSEGPCPPTWFITDWSEVGGFALLLGYIGLLGLELLHNINLSYKMTFRSCLSNEYCIVLYISFLYSALQKRHEGAIYSCPLYQLASL